MEVPFAQKQKVAAKCSDHVRWIQILWKSHDEYIPQVVMNDIPMRPTGCVLIVRQIYYLSDIFFGASDCSISSLGVAAPQAGQA
jgi:hypothetical protein